MKKFVFLISFSLIFLASCSQVIAMHNKGLEKSISSALEKNSVTEIDLNSLTGFDWDKAYLITPYTDQETINKQLGVKFKDPTNMAYRDDIYLLVFLVKNEVVQYVKIPTKFGSLMHGNKDGITPSNAIIKIHKK
ncbi:hypothetical protein [Neobacillus vireti]|uniref:Lipoprotein n=1 Tax=Neobacillus vireti LMG 21834 TaxID=1131730 RepID=A0AB94ITV3_9BACI|nr:hypothetical protein [Neobacillus vireti]ETI70509.1 hypothetical protein BAVI_02134 [Neobacillus vireti LMG 21834]KLT19920.1 hypothetical protein AA980_05060 [Neobacillus vireti]